MSTVHPLARGPPSACARPRRAAGHDDRAALVRAVSREQERESALAIVEAQALRAPDAVDARAPAVAPPKSALEVAERDPRPFVSPTAQRRPPEPSLSVAFARLRLPLAGPHRWSGWSGRSTRSATWAAPST